ncbi:hypothetical protein WN51_11169 [Melipona quadrifasciata]|uniref:Uncharacterized protein n=1 Tax=Melipona quadrifasciata TaxID=166423 RepID=A0A0N0BHW9_9HYME|nr:hypothetical protein WN51_11169 [Melipona quadrifasciata]
MKPAVCQCAKSGFEHLEGSSPALPPTTQWGSEEPLSRITKDAGLQEPHLFDLRPIDKIVKCQPNARTTKVVEMSNL